MTNIMPQNTTTYQQVIGAPIAWCTYRKHPAWTWRYYISPYSGCVHEVGDQEFAEFIRDNGLEWDAVSESYQ